MIDSKPYVLRELMPSQDKLDLASWNGKHEGLDLLARDLGYLLAWSELRSSGRNGSATIDELIEFAHQKRWRRSIVEYAKEYRETAWQDWKLFRQAYRDQALPTA